MEECDEGPAPAARVGSGAAGVHPAQARADVGTRYRAQPHAGPQIAAQQKAAQQRHALLQEAMTARGPRVLVGRVQLGGRSAQAAGRQVARLGFLPARAVGYGQPGGNRQHQPMAAHAGYPLGGLQAAGLVPLPADGLQAPEALLNPVAAGIQGGLRLRHGRVGQQYPGLRLTVGLPHAPTGPPSTVQRLRAEGPAGAHPQVARSRDQRAHCYALALALRLKGDMGRVAQAGMPTQRVPERHNLRPQVPTAQPLVTEHMHRHRGRHGRGQPPQQAAEVVNPGLPGLGPHDVPGHGNRMLAVDPTDHERHQVILFRSGSRGQHPRLLRQLPPARGHPPPAHSAQQRGEAARHFQFLPLPPGLNAIRIVIQQLPLQAAQRVRVGGAPGAMRQGQGHRILTAVQGQQRAFHPQSQHRPQVAGQIRQLRFQQVAHVIQCGRSMHGHTRGLSSC